MGCKVGYNSLALCQQSGVALTGVDVSAMDIEIARFLAKAGRIEGARFAEPIRVNTCRATALT